MTIKPYVAPKSTNAVAYLRTASADREDSRLGLERQRQLCDEFAHQLGLRITGTYSDVGVSGLSEQRPGLERLLLDLASESIGYVLTADRARLARSVSLARSLEERITRSGANLVTGEQL
jgi:DNA invertase Pin-like site-specific DNA recombinase